MAEFVSGQDVELSGQPFVMQIDAQNPVASVVQFMLSTIYAAGTAQNYQNGMSSSDAAVNRLNNDLAAIAANNLDGLAQGTYYFTGPVGTSGQAYVYQLDNTGTSPAITIDPANQDDTYSYGAGESYLLPNTQITVTLGTGGQIPGMVYVAPSGAVSITGTYGNTTVSVGANSPITISPFGTDGGTQIDLGTNTAGQTILADIDGLGNLSYVVGGVSLMTAPAGSTFDTSFNSLTSMLQMATVSATGLSEGIDLNSATGDGSITLAGQTVLSFAAGMQVSDAGGLLTASDTSNGWTDTAQISAGGTLAQTFSTTDSAGDALSLDYGSGGLSLLTMAGQSWQAGSGNDLNAWVVSTMDTAGSVAGSTAGTETQSRLTTDRDTIEAAVTSGDTSALPADVAGLGLSALIGWAAADMGYAQAAGQAAADNDVAEPPPPPAPPAPKEEGHQTFIYSEGGCSYETIDGALINEPAPPKTYTVEQLMALALAGVNVSGYSISLSAGGDLPSDWTAEVIGYGDDAYDFDPLVLSTDGKGITLTSLAQSGASYDYSGNGVALPTGWVGADTGVLVSVGSDGSISLVRNFAALEALDANGDGIIDVRDPGFADLEVWVGGDGRTGSGKLVSLSSLGIISISVSSTATDQTVAGNIITAAGTATFSDGRTEAIDDVSFATGSSATTPTLDGESAAALGFVKRAGALLPVKAEDSAQEVTTSAESWQSGFATETAFSTLAVQVTEADGTVKTFDVTSALTAATGAVSQALASLATAAGEVATAGEDQSYAEQAALAADVANAVVGGSEDGGASVSALAAEQAWQPALADVVAGSAVLQTAVEQLVLSNGALYCTDGDAMNAQVVFDVQNADSEYLVEDASAYTVLLDAVAEAWDVGQVTVAAAGTSVSAAGGDLVVAASGSETVTEAASPSVYAVLPGAGLTIDGFHAGSGGSRLDFLGASGTLTLSQQSSGAELTLGSANVLLQGVSLSTLSFFGNIAGVSSAAVTGSGLVLDLASGSDAFDDATTHITTLAVTGASDTLIANNGIAVLTADGSSNTLVGGIGYDTLTAGGSGNVLIGADGVSSLTASGSANTLIGNDDEDFLTVNGAGTGNVLIAGAGVEALNVTATTGARQQHDTLIAGRETDILKLDADSSTLVGGSGGDMMIAEGVGNTLVGGSGNDLLMAEGSQNVINGGSGYSVLVSDAGGNTLIAGTGVTQAFYAASDLVIDLASGTETQNDVAGDTLIGIASVQVEGDDDTVVAGSGTGTLWANGKNDELEGGTGTTTLVSDLDGNILTGGGGRTEAFYSGDHVVVSLQAGMAISSGGVGSSDTLVSLDAAAVAGSDNTLIGSAAGGDVLVALSGSNDTLMAAGGANTLIAGSGAATLVSAVVGGNTLIAGNGTAEVAYGGNGIAVDLGTGLATANGTADTLVGNFAVAAATGADDTLVGGAGTTTLVGDLGGGTLIAGMGVTWAWYGGNQVTVDLGAGSAEATGGSDALVGITDAAAAGAGDALVAAGGDTVVALGADDTLVASGSGNVLEGGAFVSTLVGDLAGNTLMAGSGTAVASYGAPGTVVDLASGVAAAGGASDTLVGITVAQATAGGETLIGAAGSSTLIGSGAGDTLIAGSTLTEAYYAGGDMTVDLGGGTAVQDGTDWGDTLVGITWAAVSGNGNTVLAAGGDVVLALSGQGNTLIAEGVGNTLEGGAGTTTLIGDAAGNVMLGGAGPTVAYYAADDVAIDLAADTARVAGATAGDTVLGIAEVVLTGNGQTLIGSSQGGDVLVADEGENDTLIAQAAGNTLEGGFGTSTLIGDALGNTLIAGSGLTRASYGAADVTVDLNAGTARVNGATTYDTLIGFKAAQVYGVGDTLIGSSSGGDDLEITGRNDTLVAGGDGDVLRGGASAGTLVSDAAGNTLIAGSGQIIAYYAGDDVTVDLATGSAEVNGASVSDTLVGIAAAEAAGHGDTLIGGTGTSTLVGDLAGGTLIAGRGTAEAVYTIDNAVVDLGAGTASLTGASLGDTLMGITNGRIEGADDTLVGAAMGGAVLTADGAGDTLVSRTASDTLVGMADVAAEYLANGLLVDLATGTVSGGGASGLVTGIADVTVAGGADTLIGGAGVDTLTAAGTGDLLSDNGGAGTLIAAGTAGTLIATGNTTLVGDGAGNTLVGDIGVYMPGMVVTNVYQFGSVVIDSVWGLASYSKATGIAAYTADDVAVSLSSSYTWSDNPANNAENVTLTTFGTASLVGAGTDTLLNVAILKASGSHDTLAVGNGFANTLVGGSDSIGLVTLIAEGSNDTLIASGVSTLISNLAGNTLIGGDAFYANAGVTVNLSGGWARAAGGAISDSLIGVSMAEVTGNRATLTGGAGDTLAAGGDNDALIGGGSTTLTVGRTQTLVGGGGTLLADGRNDTLVGDGDCTLIATGDNDTLFGQAGDVLIGLGENDTLIGEGGATLYGTGLNDTLIGGGSTLIANGVDDLLMTSGGFDTLGSAIAGNGSEIFIYVDWLFSDIYGMAYYGGTYSSYRYNNGYYYGEIRSTYDPGGDDADVMTVATNGIINLNTSYWPSNQAIAKAVGSREVLRGLNAEGSSSTLMTNDAGNTLIAGQVFPNSLTIAYLYTDDTALNFNNNGNETLSVFQPGSDTLIGVTIGVAGGTNDILIGGNQDTLIGSLGVSTLIGDLEANTLVAGIGPTEALFRGEHVVVDLTRQFANDGPQGWDKLIGITVAGVVGANDTLIGGIGATTLVGNGGDYSTNDTLIAGGGPTELYYAWNRSVVNIASRAATADWGASSFDTLIGNFSSAVVAGWLGTIIGGGACPVLEAAGSYDTLIGGSDSSTLVGDGQSSRLVAGSGPTELYYDWDSLYLDLNEGIAMALNKWGGDLYWDTISNAADTLAEYDTLFGAFSSVVVAGNNDTVDGGVFSSVLVAAGNGDTLISSGSGSNTLCAAGNNDVLFAGGGDTMIATGRGDQLYGTGTDTLVAAGNAETLIGSGVDTLVAAGSGDVLDGSECDAGTLIGNLAGNTLVSEGGEFWSSDAMVYYTGDAITLDLDDGSPTLAADGSIQTMNGWASGSRGIDRLVNVHAAEITGNQDTLIGEEVGQATLVAAGDDDTLIGCGVDNTLEIAGGHKDTLISSSDDLRGDTLITDDANGNTLISGTYGGWISYTESGLAIDLTTGVALDKETGQSDVLIGAFDTVQVTGDSDTLIDSSWVSASNGDILETDGNDNTLIAGIGTSTLEANGTNNTLIGSGDASVLSVVAVGGNTLIAESERSAVQYSADDVVLDLGNPMVRQNGSGKNDILIGQVSTASVLGANDTLIGSNSGGDYLSAFGMDDTVISIGGNNTLIGFGYETLISNISNNTLIAQETAVAVFGEKSIVVDLATGLATASGAASDTLIGLSVVEVTGSGDTLIGGSSADTLMSNGAGNTLIAGGGATTAGIFADNVTVDAKAGTAKVNGASLGDTLVGAMGAYLVAGNDDTLIGSAAGDMTLMASGVNDTLIAQGGANTLVGGNGTSILVNTVGGNTLTGGSGATAVYGGSGIVIMWVNSYLAEAGLAADWTGTSFSAGAVDHLSNIESAGVDGSNDTLVGLGSSTTLSGNLGGNTLIHGTAYYDSNFATIDFGAGKATANGSTLVGDTLYHVSMVEAGGSHDTLISAANDTLSASGLFDTLVAGSRVNTLMATGGSDSYLFDLSSGQAVIVNGSPGSAAASNELDFGPGITDKQLWFQQSGSDLQIDVMGTSSQVTISDWFAGTGNQLKEITAGGLQIDSQIAQLVQAMAAYSADNPGFNPTAAANANAPNDPTLQSAIAAAWR